ncbi:MAG: hypothetical protein U0528_13345 [Anaerolineae bacterium]
MSDLSHSAVRGYELRECIGVADRAQSTAPFKRVSSAKSPSR